MLTENDTIRLVLGLKVRSLRLNKNLSYQQLSDATGLAISYLHDIENGKKYPKANKILSLAKALGVEYDFLVSLTGDKKLQPVIDLINSDFINAIPWEHFGLSINSLLGLFFNAPDKVTAFISTLIKIFRSYEMSKENFYTSALRSYQDLHNNYFEELEHAATTFRQQHALDEDATITAERLEKLITSQGIKVDRRKISNQQHLNNIRAYYSTKNRTLYLNKLSQQQEAFIFARELGYIHLQLTDRPYVMAMRNPTSFEMVLNNFKASYFAAALLIPEGALIEGLYSLVKVPAWNSKNWIAEMLKYNATQEMFMQRLTNILPKHFGADQLFFLRMTQNAADSSIEMTKELHLTQLHNPHANATNEHYCRRWIAAKTMNIAGTLAKKMSYKKPIIEIQVSHYWQTHNRYLCISMAKPQNGSSGDAVSVTIGIALDSTLQANMPFVNDPNIPVITVNTTCERCAIMDCELRAYAPIVIEKNANDEKVTQLLSKLDE